MATNGQIVVPRGLYDAPNTNRNEAKEQHMEKYETTVAFIITFFVGLALAPYVALLGFCGV